MRKIGRISIFYFIFHFFIGSSWQLLQKSVRKRTCYMAITEQLPKSQVTDTKLSPKHFISNLIEGDLLNRLNGGRIVTRFPPEPNGYLHLGHAKSICLNFGIASAYNGVTNMRFDDTNPSKEDLKYVHSIIDDVRWLITGKIENESSPWNGEVRHASDYFQTFYDGAIYLIQNGLAYVDDLTNDEMKEYRGTLTERGKDSPYRSRSIEQNLELFQAMKEGKFPDGKCVLRAKIDNSSPNMNMRDPTLYRIKRASHPITGDKWCIYPMYDYAHAISDAMEGITHSLCTLEFADHRPLYDWVIDTLAPSGLIPHSEKEWRPRQSEFSRLNLQYTVLSKRKLIQLVTEQHVQGWDDPRMPTICGVRRRGYPASAIRLFCDRIGISKAENNIDMAVLEDCVREVLDHDAKRSFAVLDPIIITLSNWNDDRVVELEADYHPKRPELGSRTIPFSKYLYIDKDDFFDTGVDSCIPPPKGYKRLIPNGIVRLKYGYVIQCDRVVRDSAGQAIELICSIDERSKGGVTPNGSKKAKGIIQWVSVFHAIGAELRLYDRLFNTASPGKDQPDGDFLKDINKDSIKIYHRAMLEPSLAHATAGQFFQFERVGYYCLDPVSNTSDKGLVFNRIATLKGTWSTKV